MPTDELFTRQAIVLAIALIYWVGVMIQARSVRHKIGRQPNVRPRGTRERVLWAGWVLVVVTWMTLPFVVGLETGNALLDLSPALLHPAGLVLGTALILGGYAGTHWCYVSMGDTWRMGIDHDEQTTLVMRGPYSTVRHPIYLFQVILLVGVLVLLPAPLALLILPVHLICVWFKLTDEEAHLLKLHGQDYRDYCSQTGRLLPGLFRKAPGNR